MKLVEIIFIWTARTVPAFVVYANYCKEGIGLGENNPLEEKIEILRSELYSFYKWDKNTRLCCDTYAKSLELDKLIVRYMKSHRK